MFSHFVSKDSNHLSSVRRRRSLSILNSTLIPAGIKFQGALKFSGHECEALVDARLLDVGLEELDGGEPRVGFVPGRTKGRTSAGCSTTVQF